MIGFFLGYQLGTPLSFIPDLAIFGRICPQFGGFASCLAVMGGIRFSYVGGVFPSFWVIFWVYIALLSKRGGV